jgi:hypothetical protein
MHTETVERGPENKNMGTLSLLFDRKGIIGPSDLIKYNGLAVPLHKQLVERRRADAGPTRDIWLACSSRYSPALLLVMSRLDTILNPQDNDTPALRFGYVYYAEVSTKRSF